MKVQQIKDHQELEKFSNSYQKTSGLAIDTNYLLQSRVFGLYIKGVLSGGYIINAIQTESRTINCFISEAQRHKYESHIKMEKTAEVCCFWLKSRIPNYQWVSSYLWLHIATKTSLTSAASILYGTNTYALAKVYAFPTKSILIHADHINNRNTWVFKARRKDFLLGIISILTNRLSRKSKRTKA